MIRVALAEVVRTTGAPRVSGDDPSQKVFWTSISECSPRERG